MSTATASRLPTPVTSPSGADQRPTLRLVPPPSGAGGGRSRRWSLLLSMLAVGGLLVVGVLLVGGAEATTAPASSSADVVVRDGHVVLQPGQALWDVAVATAGPGVDPRRQLARIVDLNGVDASDVATWTVLRLPDG